MPASTVLCLGAADSGKTTLLRRLQTRLQEKSAGKEGDEIPVPLQPTTGVSHYNFQFSNQNEASSEVGCFNWQLSPSKSKQVLIKEFGGSLAPAWIGYLRSSLSGSDTTKGVLFAIDLSNPAKLAESGVHLVEVLQFVKTVGGEIKFLILFTKADLVNNLEKSLRETRALLRLDLLEHNFSFLETLTVSSETDFGLGELEQYLSILQ